MKYIIHYDVAALVVTFAAMIHFFCKKTINTRQTGVFTLLIWLALLSNVLDIVTIFTIEHPSGIPVWLNYILNEAYLITFNGTSAAYFVYIIIATKDRNQLTLWDRIWMIAPISIDVLLILTTPLTKGVFYFDAMKTYLHGGLFFVLYVNAMLYVGFSLIHTIRYRKRLTRGQRMTVYFYTVSSLAAVVVQMQFEKLMIVQFAVAISVLLIYLSLENPEDYSDKYLGTYNNMAFYEVVSSYIEHDKKFEILGIQVDGLKYINETLGVSSGNHLIKDVAEFLLETAGNKRVFHISGVRFAIVAEKKELDWDMLIRHIHERFRRPFQVAGAEISLSVPMCMLGYPDNVNRLEDAIDMIEYSLEEAKAAGNETVIYAGESTLEKGKRENKILQIMKQAIREKKFEVYYQPIYSVKEQRYTSAEALVRLKHEELGFISPEEFIPLAEKNGMILEIGEFVFREVCRFMTEERIWEQGIESIDVNLSVVQCMQEKLYESLLQIMDEYHLDYSHMNLEITETAAVVSRETLRSNMQHLVDKGVDFAMDDYGTGFSNTATIIEYPFHTIKLDKSMVWSSMKNEKAMCALKHTMAMIKDMNMELIAEGVEDAEQAEKLKDMGCDFFQGYYYSKPVCREEFLEKVIAQCG